VKFQKGEIPNSQTCLPADKFQIPKPKVFNFGIWDLFFGIFVFQNDQ